MERDMEARNKSIKKRLIDLELKQKELAALAGMPPAYLNDMLQGRKSGRKYEERILAILAELEARRRSRAG